MAKNRAMIDTKDRLTQISNMAMNEAARRIEEGTASSQIITQYMKYADAENQLKLEKLQLENENLRLRNKQLESGTDADTLAKDAMEAIAGYRGNVYA